MITHEMNTIKLQRVNVVIQHYMNALLMHYCLKNYCHYFIHLNQFVVSLICFP